MQYWLIKDIHFTWSGVLAMLDEDLLKDDNLIKTCLISPNIALYYS